MSQEKLSRRDLLKMLAAATGAAVLSTVPNKWKTPVVEVGALPAHAQGSLGTGNITGVVFEASNGGAPSKSRPASRAPIPSASVQVNGTSLSAVTNQQGQYTIMNVPVGLRTLTASANCYLNNQGNINVLGGQTVILNIGLPIDPLCY